MSRGERVAVNGNLSTSMRDNYSEHGIAKYYAKVGATYRNPHYPGIRICMFDWLNRWWMNEHLDSFSSKPEVMLFDLACGSGEATLAFTEWCFAGKQLHLQTHIESSIHDNKKTVAPGRKGAVEPIALDQKFPKPRIIATDPFTSQAYKGRTSYPCSDLSFDSIAEGAVPPESINIVDKTLRPFPSLQGAVVSCEGQVTGGSAATEGTTPPLAIEMVVCSFALHLIEDSSKLFALLWELSLKARWLVVLAPHKRPEIKDGWGWYKWDLETWKVCQAFGNPGELLHERVHCRVYRSINV